MSSESRPVNRALVIDALRELSNLDFQERVWVHGSSTEVSSMNEVAAALFNDSGLDVALEKTPITFSPEADQELRQLRSMLQRAMQQQVELSTHAVIQSAEWKRVRLSATRLIEVISRIGPSMN